MAVRSRVVFATTAIPIADGVVYTAPSGRTAIIKTLVMFNRDAATQTVSLAINASAAASPLMKFSIATQAHSILQLFLVLDPGDALHAVVTGANVGRIAGFGALLEGAPS